MKVTVAQMNVSDDIKNNLNKILFVLDQIGKNNIVIFPEGMISCFDLGKEDFFEKLDENSIEHSVGIIKEKVFQKDINCIVGTLYRENNNWYNSALFISKNEFNNYKKLNISVLEKGRVTMGDNLRTYSFNNTIFGIQVCREIVFPEQWKLLKIKGAKVIFHINNAIRETDQTREHLLISRAFENQIWVCSVNNAAKSQTMASMVINPLGEIVWRSTPGIEQVSTVDIDLELVSDQYLRDERTDIVDIIDKQTHKLERE